MFWVFCGERGRDNLDDVLVTLQPHDGVYLVQGGTVVDLALLGDIFDR
jgi:hypothetical protein